MGGNRCFLKTKLQDRVQLHELVRPQILNPQERSLFPPAQLRLGNKIILFNNLEKFRLPNFARQALTFSLRFRLSFQFLSCQSGLGLRAIWICKPRQVRKKATVVDTRMCRGTTRGLASLRCLFLGTLTNQGRSLSSESLC